ncbi:MAG: DNA translocase FtsK 4TM domain-containing protein [Candidatus Nomurabacteria bacterium]|jgi:S-DNA-T family DNA segregation ATPase FtsK/SpoIIIE|nr:DNA translocase FtsK 4TM domain-containing protein [Candidatus Nomurabacteria bacterium]
MAKKRGKKNKEVAKAHELPGGFWRQVVALLMIVVSILLVVTWFGSGGNILNNIHGGGLWAVGYAIYLLPVLLVYLAVSIFRSADNKLPITVWLASMLMIVWFAGMFGVPTIGKEDPTGGKLGEALNGAVTQLVDPGIAIFIYIVLVLITILFVLSKTPMALFRAIQKTFRSNKSKEDVANAKIMRQATDELSSAEMKDLKVKSGVDVMEIGKKSGKDTKKGADMPKKDESKSALVAISDPNWKMPPLELLEKKQSPADAGNIQQNALVIKNTLNEFGIEVEMEGANIGPRVTQYTMRPPAGVKLTKITVLDRDLSLNLAKDKIRIEAPIPGTRSVGVEIPNNKSADVGLRGVLESEEWKSNANPLVFAVGKDISGQAVVGNLAKMPHLLIAGTTGSGKSVMTNTLISSLLYRNSPSDLKLIIVDPKQVEMAQYEDIPHLLTPVITSVEKALSSLKWAVNEMERRYSLMAEEKVKNIGDYNEKMAKNGGKVTVEDEDGNPQKHDGGKMPYIIVIVDEMADLMMMAGKELEMLIVRIAQKGRASGIHLVLATQRPEVKVVTGLIKANIPGRIAFAVNNNIDSRVMLDMGGAEKLLGMGDMLFLTTDMMGKPKRVQGAYVSDAEISRMADYLRQQSPPDYNEDVINQPVQIKGMPGIEMNAELSGAGDLARQATEVGLQARKMSTSLLQRRLKIGYGKAAAVIDELEEMGVVASPNGNRPRDMLISSMEEYPG